MKILLTSIILLSTLGIYPQADLTIKLFLYDNGNPPYGGEESIYFGLDSTATDGIDAHLGEMQYPPDICPTWWPYFCAKFILPPFNGYLDSPRDFRFGELPFTGQKEHRIFCVSDDTIITINYNLPFGVVLNLSDVFGGVLFTATLADSGDITIPYEYFYSGQIRMFANYNNVVPIELISFNAEQITNLILLNWSTASEYNNSGYEIERNFAGSLPGGEWEGWVGIGFVPGFGTTTEPKSYLFTDENVTTGTYKYRLKQVNFDGTFNFSKEIEVVVDFTPKEFLLYQNYPNPFNPRTTIKFEIPSVIASGAKQSQLVTLKVYDILGNEVATLVNEEKQSGFYEIEFDASSLASGLYLYKLQADNFVQTKKMILAK